MFSPQAIAIAAALGLLLYGGDAAIHSIKKAEQKLRHGIVHVVTLGHK